MTYQVIWLESALLDLKKITKQQAERIKKKVDNHLIHNPVHMSEALSGEFSGLYRYRVGNYRVIHTIERQTVTISIIKIGHRSDVYKTH